MKRSLGELSAAASGNAAADAECGYGANRLERIVSQVVPMISADSRVLSVRGPSNLTALVEYSILCAVPVNLRDELLAVAATVPGADRAAGALCGLAIADALGASLEFLPAVDEPSAQTHVNAATLEVVGASAAPEMTKAKALQPGQWTDDTAMALCLADSLLVTRWYCGRDIRLRFWNWWHRGYNNGFANDTKWAERRSVGLGMNIGKSLDAIKDDAPTACYEALSNDAGNGSLIRLAPMPITFARGSVEQAMAVLAESSRTTHPGRLASSACRFLGFLLWNALNRPDSEHGSIRTFIDQTVGEYLEKHSHDGEVERLLRSNEPAGVEQCWNWRQDHLAIAASLDARAIDGAYNGYPVWREYFGSFCLDGLAVALHCVYHSASYDSAVVRCVNFLGDADSTAAICGQIAGAFYGAINEGIMMIPV